MTTQRMASPNESPSPLKVDVLQLFLFLLGAPNIQGAFRAAGRPQRKFAFPAYSYLVPLAAVIAGGVEFWLM
jgi:hypothetical protein